MRTAVIKHRVADFLRQHAPFDCLGMEDLLLLADSGRVSFHQANELICRAGEPRKPFVYVVQQGRVDLYEQGSDRLRDILAAGDTIGLECLLPGTRYLHTARTASDVILYGLDSETFTKVAGGYAEMTRFLAAHLAAADMQGPSLSWTSHVLPVDHIAEEGLACMPAASSLGEVIAALGRSGAHLAITDAGSVTLGEAAAALATGRLCLSDPVDTILKTVPSAHSSTTTGDLSLLLIQADADAVSIDAGGQKAIVTAESLSRATLYNAVTAVKCVRRARGPAQLNRLRVSTDALVRAAVTGPDTIEWAGLYTSERNRAIIGNLLPDFGGAVLCFGADARTERVRSTLPVLGLAYREPRGSHPQAAETLDELNEGLRSCGFAAETKAVSQLRSRSLMEWKNFYRDLIEDPIGQEIYHKREYLDLRLAAGDPAVLQELKDSIARDLRSHPEFAFILANDALGKLPPLTFYRDAVVDIEGGASPNLDLQKVALTPLVDSSRALALSAIDLDAASTVERLRRSADLFPEARKTCQDAVEAFRFAAYQASSRRDVIHPGTLNKYEREMLKSAFRSIAVLLKFLSIRAGFAEE